MPSAIQQDIDWPIDHLIKAKIDQQRFLYNHSEEDRMVRMEAPMFLVERAEFDYHFVKRALDLGQGRVVLRDNTQVKGVAEDTDGVTITLQDGTVVRARFVIAADGASSRVARALGLFAKPQGAGIDALIKTDDDTFNKESRRVTFNVHCVASGYGWIFPKDDHLSCGVGMWRNPRNMSKAMDTFLEQSLPSGDIRDEVRLTHPVPVFSGHRPVSTDRVCLVGDAAHLVDPILGEGIKYAIQSGQTAAEVIANLLDAERSHDPDTGQDADFQTCVAQHGNCMAYGSIIRHTIARHLNLIRLREDAFFSDPEAVYQAVVA